MKFENAGNKQWGTPDNFKAWDYILERCSWGGGREGLRWELEVFVKGELHYLPGVESVPTLHTFNIKSNLNPKILRQFFKHLHLVN